MTKRPVKDVAASVRQRLLNAARAENRPFQEVLQYFAMERFLFRLTRSRYADKFVLKGALMFVAWDAPVSRPTRDIDLLGRMKFDIPSVVDAIRDVCNASVEPDGLVYPTTDIAGVTIKKDADYEGVRVTFGALLQNARVPMQIDIGFGDVITPAATSLAYPTILDFPAPTVQAYNRETVVAEKFEAMVKLGLLNSRLKDFFDLWFLARRFIFDGPTLSRAIEATFRRRKTPLPTQPPVAMTPEFGNDAMKMKQWKAFITKGRLDAGGISLVQLCEYLTTFLMPIVESLMGGREFRLVWPAGGPWSALSRHTSTPLR